MAGLRRKPSVSFLTTLGIGINNHVMAENNSSVKHFSKSEAINFGFETAKKNLFFYFALFVICAFLVLAYIVLQAILVSNFGILGSFITGIVNWAVTASITLGFVNIALKLIDKKKPEYKDLFFQDWGLVFMYIITNVIRQIIIIVGLILFIIPGIIFAIKLQFVDYLIVDKKMGIDSLSKSWNMTKGVKWNLFLLWILIALINIAGALLLLVGLFITVPLSMVATAYVYRKLS